VPPGSLAQYHSADGWSEFDNIQEFDTTTGTKPYTNQVSFKLTGRVLELSNLSHPVEVSIYNISGQIILNTHLSLHETFTLPDLQEGVYIIRAKANSGVFAKKIMVQ